MSQTIIFEAAYLISSVEHISTEYLLAEFSPRELVSFARKINRARENSMDSIRESWLGGM